MEIATSVPVIGGVMPHGIDFQRRFVPVDVRTCLLVPKLPEESDIFSASKIGACS